MYTCIYSASVGTMELSSRQTTVDAGPLQAERPPKPRKPAEGEATCSWRGGGGDGRRGGGDGRRWEVEGGGGDGRALEWRESIGRNFPTNPSIPPKSFHYSPSPRTGRKGRRSPGWPPWRVPPVHTMCHDPAIGMIPTIDPDN